MILRIRKKGLLRLLVPALLLIWFGSRCRVVAVVILGPRSYMILAKAHEQQGAEILYDSQKASWNLDGGLLVPALLSLSFGRQV